MTFPWRDTYDLGDPNRVCFTCGTPPASSFPDGSPMYRCGPHNEPIRAPRLDGWVPGLVSSTIVRLTEEEMAVERAWTVQVMEDNAKHPERGMTHAPPKGETEFDVKLRGFAAERAASKATGLPLNRVLGTHRPKLHDIGRRVEVKNVRYPNGRLRAWPKDVRSYVFLLVTGNGPEFRLVGWLEGVDLIRGRNRDKDADSCSVGQGALHPLPLPADA